MSTLALHTTTALHTRLQRLVRALGLESVVVVGDGARDLLPGLATFGVPLWAIDPRRERLARWPAVAPERALCGTPRRVLADLRRHLGRRGLYVFSECGLGAGALRDAWFEIPRGAGAVLVGPAHGGAVAGIGELGDALARWSPDHDLRPLLDEHGRAWWLATPAPRVHVTFLIERYTHAYGSSGLSINLDNLVGTLSATGLATANVVHYDQCAHEDRPLPLAELAKPAGCDAHVVVTVLHYHSRANPTPELLQSLRAAGSRVVIAWLDKRISRASDAYYGAADVNVVFDGNEFDVPNAWPVFTPKNPRWFHDPGLERDLGVSLVGEVRYLSQRKAIVDRLRTETRVAVQMVGTSAADTGRSLPVAEYARLYQRSRISLAMTKDSARQLKGRVFEITHCGALLCCDVNHHVRHYFEPGREYVEYRDYEDLVAVLQHYLHHDDERAAIAAAGHRRATLHYSHQVFWRGLLARCGASATAFADRLEGDEP